MEMSSPNNRKEPFGMLAACTDLTTAIEAVKTLILDNLNNFPLSEELKKEFIPKARRTLICGASVKSCCDQNYNLHDLPSIPSTASKIIGKATAVKNLSLQLVQQATLIIKDEYAPLIQRRKELDDLFDSISRTLFEILASQCELQRSEIKKLLGEWKLSQTQRDLSSASSAAQNFTEQMKRCVELTDAMKLDMGEELKLVTVRVLKAAKALEDRMQEYDVYFRKFDAAIQAVIQLLDKLIARTSGSEDLPMKGTTEVDNINSSPTSDLLGSRSPQTTRSDLMTAENDLLFSTQRTSSGPDSNLSSQSGDVLLHGSKPNQSSISGEEKSNEDIVEDKYKKYERKLSFIVRRNRSKAQTINSNTNNGDATAPDPSNGANREDDLNNKLPKDSNMRTNSLASIPDNSPSHTHDAVKYKQLEKDLSSVDDIYYRSPQKHPSVTKNQEAASRDLMDVSITTEERFKSQVVDFLTAFQNNTGNGSQPELQDSCSDSHVSLEQSIKDITPIDLYSSKAKHGRTKEPQDLEDHHLSRRNGEEGDYYDSPSTPPPSPSRSASGSRSAPTSPLSASGHHVSVSGSLSNSFASERKRPASAGRIHQPPAPPSVFSQPGRNLQSTTEVNLEKEIDELRVSLLSRYPVRAHSGKVVAPEAYNFIIFGEYGSGKSSFVNTMHKACYQNEFYSSFEKTATHDSSRDGTKTLSKLHITPKIRLYDTRGLVQFEKHELQQVKMQLGSGRRIAKDGALVVQRDVTFFDKILFRDPDKIFGSDRTEKLTIHNMPHFIYIVVSCAGPFPNSIDNIVSIASSEEHKIPFMFLITHTDVGDATKCRKNILANFSDQAIPNLENQIFEIENYHLSQEQRSLLQSDYNTFAFPNKADIDVAALTALRVGCNQADFFIKRRYDSVVKRRFPFFRRRSSTGVL